MTHEDPDSVRNSETEPAPPLKEQTLAHMSNRLLAMGEELRDIGRGVATFGGTVDEHDSKIRRLERRVRELEQRVGTGEHATVGDEG